MNENFLNYEQALALKELGFDEPCLDRYDPRFGKLSSDMETWTQEYYPETLMIPAPLKQQVFRWFREKYGMLGVVNVAPQGFYYYDINKIDPYKEINQDVDFDSFEEAEDECINHIIKLINKIV